MEQVIEPLAATRHAQDLRETWQARVLIETRQTPMGAVVLSVLAHTFDDTMETLLRVCFPGFVSITAPFLCTAGKVMKDGSIAADIVQRNGKITKFAKIFANEQVMQGAFRRLADKMKLSDSDRVQLFKCVQRWVVCDYRIDPTMDPQDPDARRLLH